MPTKSQLEAAKLWRAAEGKSLTVDGPAPTRREQSAAQIKFSESIAYGGLATQLQPALVRTLRSYFDSTPVVADQFTRLWELEGIDRDEEYNIYGFNQDDIPETNNGDTFIPGGLPSIGRRESYPEIGVQASGKKGRVSKVGEAFGIDWESLVNSKGSKINLIRDAIERFGRDAANEGDIRVAKQLVNSSGFVTTGEMANATALTGNPDLLDPLSLAEAIAQLQAVQVQGMENEVSKFVVLTSVANAPKIRQGIANRRIIRNPGVEAGASWEETVDYGAEVEVLGFSWLKSIWSGIGSGALIVPVPRAEQLPVLTRNRLQGYAEPSFWIKDSNAKSANGGGEINPEADGDFDSDAIVSKVRHVVGASTLWANQIGYTTGSNT